MKIANLFEDIDILKTVQNLSSKIMEKDENLELKENEKLRKLIDGKVGSGRVEI